MRTAPPEVTTSDLWNEIERLRREVEPRPRDRIAETAMRIIAGVTVASLVGVFAWLAALAGSVQNNAHDIDLIRSTRFTAEMGAALRADLLDRMAQTPRWLNEAMIRLEKTAEKVEQRFDGFEQRLDEMETRLNRIETKLEGR